MAESKEDRRALLQRLNKPEAATEDRERYRELCRVCSELPWKFGTLSSRMREKAITALSACALIEESLHANLEMLGKELGAGEATGAERLLIENVLTSWFSMQLTDAKADVAVEPGHAMHMVNFWASRQDAAHKRFNQAINSLMQFRRVSIQIQVNIADKQIVGQTIRVVREDQAA